MNDPSSQYDPPAASLLIEDLETLKVLADPLRNQVMEILAPAPMTINHIAKKLGLHTSKLYYHINLLEKHGFLRVVDTTVKGNIIEKRYWLTAYHCRMDHSMWDFTTPAGQEASITSMVSLVDTTRDDLERSLRARAVALDQGAKEHPRKVSLVREIIRLSDEDADQVVEQLEAIVKQVKALSEKKDTPDTHTRALTIAFYPSFYYDQDDKEVESQN